MSDNTSSPKIIDCFIFYNEMDMLNYRLNMLYDIVDYFVLVESTRTFVGKEKPLYYNENKTMFQKFQDKIIHLVVDDTPYKSESINISNGEQWCNERHQRNSIKKGIDHLSLQPKDLIIVCDVDEVPDPEIIGGLKENGSSITINSLEMDLYYYNLTAKQDGLWGLSKILSYETYLLLNKTIDEIRTAECSSIKKAGWHMSYFGNAWFIKNKLEQFSHQEYNHEFYKNLQTIEAKVVSNMNLFDNRIITKIEIKDNPYLPKDYQIYLRNYCG